MAGRRLLLLAGFAAAPVFACAQPPPVSSENLAAMRALKLQEVCLLVHARAADDGVSDPARIAAAMGVSCHAEEDRFIEAMRGFAARHPGIEPPPSHISDSERLEAAKAAVVALRGSRAPEAAHH
jgi:hypothetical protein